MPKILENAGKLHIRRLSSVGRRFEIVATVQRNSLCGFRKMGHPVSAPILDMSEADGTTIGERARASD